MTLLHQFHAIHHFFGVEGTARWDGATALISRNSPFSEGRGFGPSGIALLHRFHVFHHFLSVGGRVRWDDAPEPISPILPLSGGRG